MATHPSILTWRIPWTEEPGGLQSIVLQSQTRLKQLITHLVVETLSLIHCLGVSRNSVKFHNIANDFASAG